MQLTPRPPTRCDSRRRTAWSSTANMRDVTARKRRTIHHHHQKHKPSDCHATHYSACLAVVLPAAARPLTRFCCRHCQNHPVPRLTPLRPNDWRTTPSSAVISRAFGLFSAASRTLASCGCCSHCAASTHPFHSAILPNHHVVTQSSHPQTRVRCAVQGVCQSRVSHLACWQRRHPSRSRSLDGPCTPRQARYSA